MGVAATIWLLNKLNRDYTTRLSYPIEIDYDQSEVIPILPPPKSVEVNVTGYGWNLLRQSSWLGKRPLRYTPSNLPATRYITNAQLYPAVQEQLPDLELNFIVQDTLFLDFDARARRKVAVVVDSQKISLEEGYRIVSPIRIEPDSVTFVGAASRLDDLPPFLMISIREKEISEDYEEEIELDYPQDNLATLLTPQVRVSFETALFRQQSIQVPVRVRNVPSQLKQPILRDTTVLVNYYINTERPTTLTVDSFQVTANFRQLNEDSTLTLTLSRTPANVFNVTLRPVRIPLRDSL
ncbi:hypothetical protein [Catalinimonas alkaloidigena]|nr:hypothetical protein [Catalinimonas alkaloidigena]